MQKDLVNPTVYNSDIIGNLKFKAPLLFDLPQSDYSAEMERVRDRSLYLKVVKLAKTSQQIKEEIQTLSTRHRKHIENIRKLIAISREVNRQFRHRRNN